MDGNQQNQQVNQHAQQYFYGPPPQPPKRWKRPALMAGSAALALTLVAGGTVAVGIDQYQRNGAQLTQSQTLDPAKLAELVKQSIVDVNVVLGYEGAKSAGTGIILSSDGVVLTNHHVVEGGTKITVRSVADNKTYEATVLGYDSTHDLALLKPKNASGLPVADLGDSSKVKVGDDVLGIGNAGGDGGEPSSAAGEVTALNQDITATDQNGQDAEQLDGLIGTSADIQPGDSGGPLVNTAGEVIGVNVAGKAGSGGGYPGQTSQRSATDIPIYGPGTGFGDPYAPDFGNGPGDGYGPGNGYYQGPGRQQDPDRDQQTEGYAIPINQAMDIVNQIKSGQESADVHIGESAMLGITVLPYSSGVVVNDTVENGPAAKAGLGAGDVITSFGGKTVTTPDDLTTLLENHKPGDKVQLTWTDQTGRSHTATTELAAGPVR